MSDKTEPNEDLYNTAHHEAAHAVVQYRASGFAGGDASIIPIPEEHTLGSHSDFYTDSGSEEDCRARVLSCYAGGHSDRKLGCYNEGQCRGDEEAASEKLKWWEWHNQERELREESRLMVEKHWIEIQAVAKELLQRRELDATEIESIADIAAGDSDASPYELEIYRAMKEGRL